jgi:hypothetical protein
LKVPKCPNFLEQKYKNKNCPNPKLFMALKKFQCVGIKSEFTFLIWNYELKTLAKPKVKSEIDNLIFHHF